MKKNIKFKIVFTLLLSSVIISCDSYLETDPDNRLTEEQVITDPSLAEGWLLKAYKGLPTNYNFNIDVATDDANTNNFGLNINNMNSGGWSANSNPVSTWNQSYEMLLYLNKFLQNVDAIAWFPNDDAKDTDFRKRITAEAKGLRAWYNFNLLQAHAGEGENGEMLGFPIVDKVLTDQDNFELPRNTFKECVDFILQDCNDAIQGLPARYTGNDPVVGERNLNRINGLAVELIKSRVALYAASPSYQTANASNWTEAATFAANVITNNGGLTLNGNDVTFYLAGNAAQQPQDIIWASTILPNVSGWENTNLPPSLFGQGRTNPTQNFVDAFSMADGTPIDQSATYDANNPYVNRDPRLEKFVIYNLSTFSGNFIKTSQTSLPDLEIDAINSVSNFKTTTGYYLKKFMNPAVSLDPSGQTVGAPHFYTYARMTEAYLNFAEAANEAGGPDNNIQGYTPRDIINAIRTRAGISSTAFVDAITSTADMRKVIQNERRIELSFEGHRFWDLRRWGLTSTMSESVEGVNISEDNLTYSKFVVAPRNYQSFQIYGPIPLSEIQKYNLIQNKGW
ncbi:RagB/SusD family nutrient uptake outer membrane protein [Polaribacter sp. M15]